VLSARWRETLEVAAAYASAAAFLAFLQFQTPFLPETDGHYHLKTALLYRTHGLFFHGFKWASQSLWRDRFSDTCLLFHAYLIPFTFFPNLAFGGKLATVLMGAACFASFFWILRANGARWPWFWFFLLCSAGPFFLWRLTVPRPQILSVTLLLWCVHFLLNGKRGKLAALSFFYALSYSAAFMPLVFSLIRSVHLWVAEEEIDAATPLAALGGLAAALLVNPYFPNDLLMLFVQNFYVLHMSITGGAEKLSMGGEFYPTDTRRMLLLHLPLAAALFSLSYYGLLTGRKAGRKTAMMMPFAVATVAMTFIWKRFTEYSVPLTLMYCGLRATELLEGFSWASASKRVREAAVIAVVALAFGFGSSTSSVMSDFRGATESPLKGAALFLKSHAEPDEAVFTCDWDDAPELYFYNHEQRYLVFMDPVFMYYRSPEVWRVWNNAANGRLGAGTARTIARTFDARYGVCKERFRALRDVVAADPAVKIVYDDGRAWVFEVPKPPGGPGR